MTRPLLFDLGCAQGGAAVGYYRAGFDVIGFDVVVQPRYPFSFVQADALDILADLVRYGGYAGREPVAVHASMPCQRWSTQTKRNGTQHRHPDLVGPVRELLQEWGGPWVMENIPAAPLREPVLLCGVALGIVYSGHWLKRHRHFEANVPLKGSGCGCKPGLTYMDVTGGGPTSKPRTDGGGGRPPKGTAAQVRALMGMPWATKTGCNEAIPPLYTEFVGGQVLAHLQAAAAA